MKDAMTQLQDEIEAINEQILKRYWAGESVASLADATGRANSTINKLVKIDKVRHPHRERTLQPKDPRIILDKRPLSTVHGIVGLHITRYMAENNLGPTQFGLMVNSSRIRVRSMEAGSHDLTVTELIKLAGVLDIPYAELAMGAISNADR